MLTFFEYLRQRAFESVLDGAQEALERLETQSCFDIPAAKINAPPQAIEQSAPAPAANAAKDSPANRQHEGQTRVAEDDGEPLRPRLRGRPKRKGSRR